MNTKQESPFHVGQEVLWYDGYGRAGREAPRRKVNRVGRKYVYVETYGGREAPFDFEGREHRGPNATGNGGRIVTPEQDALDKQRLALLIEAKRLGFDYTFPAYSTETLRQVIGILKADPAAPKPKETSK